MDAVESVERSSRLHDQAFAHSFPAMDVELTDKVALVTGAGRGIGGPWRWHSQAAGNGRACGTKRLPA